MRGALHDGKDTVEFYDNLDMPLRFPGSALVRVRRAGICGSDLHMNKERSEKQELPSGHELAGEVVAIPDGERRISVGDRVAVEAIGAGLSCGECWFCRQGHLKHCSDKAPDSGGGFAEYITRRPRGLFKVCGNVNWGEAALVEPLAVSVHGIRWGGMRPGDTVAVIGSATIGLAAIVSARHLGASMVMASARYPHQANAARMLGADVVVGGDQGELEDAARESTDGRGADFVIETVGGDSVTTLNESVEVCRKQGKIIVIGLFRQPMEFDFLKATLLEQSILLSSCYGIIDGRHDYEVAAEIMASKGTKFGDIVTHKVPLEDIQKGFEAAYDKSSGSLKVHVEI